MILVTGTKRSGTSMWMQILAAAGFPTLGKAFPKNWGETIRAANPHGFYESPLRGGIYYATNPDPITGVYLAPASTRRTVVKVFAPGLVRSDVAFLDHVLATMRSVHEYGASLQRLYTMESASHAAHAAAYAEAELPPLAHLPPWLEWWHDNYRLLCDALVRGYPLHMVSYDAALATPERTVGEVLRWLGGGDEAGAVKVVTDLARTQRSNEGNSREATIPGHIETVFDELYARVHEQRPLDAPFIAALNATQDALEPELNVALERLRKSRAIRRAARARLEVSRLR